MTDDFEKAMRDQAKHEDSDGYFGFLEGATWAKSYLEKTTVPQEIVGELVSGIDAIEHAIRYIQYALEFDDTSKNTVGLEENTLPKLKEIITSYREWRKSNE